MNSRCQVPMSCVRLDNLHDLALNCEREPRYVESESELPDLHGFNPKCRDIERRLTHAMRLSESAMLTGGIETTDMRVHGARAERRLRNVAKGPLNSGEDIEP